MPQYFFKSRGVPPRPTVSDPWSAWDGFPLAPVNTGGPQLPTALALISARPPWQVAGVDYPVAANTNMPLADASVQANLPAGATANSGAKTVTISAANVTLNGFQFPADWIVVIGAGASGVATIWNCKFSGSLSTTLNFIVQNVNCSLDIRYCDFNGGKVSSVSAPLTAAAIAILANCPSAIIYYNDFHGLPMDAISFSGANTIGTIDVRYNLFNGLGYASGSTPDSAQQSQITCSNYNFSYNTLYNPPDANQFTPGIAMQVKALTAGFLNGGRLCNNTITGFNRANGYTLAVGMYSIGAPLTNFAVSHNFIDPNAVAIGGSVWGGGASAYSGANLSFTGNVDMSTGLTTDPAPNPGIVIIENDVASAPASSPSSGNVSTGQTVAITVTLNQVFNVVGTPRLTLNSGGSALFTSGSGSNALLFIYTPGASENATALAITGLNLAGGTILDQNGNPANFSGAAVTLGVSVNKPIASMAWFKQFDQPHQILVRIEQSIFVPLPMVASGWSAIDGSLNAPTGTPQYPNLCDTNPATNTNGKAFAVRPPWKVAGVDYRVGINTGVVLQPISGASIPGVTLNTSTHTASAGGSAVTIDGYDWTGAANGGNDWRLLINGNSPVTVRNCRLQQRLGNSSGTNPIQVPSNTTGSACLLTVMYCEFDGNGLALNAAASSNADLQMILVGQGSCVIQYCWFKNMLSDAINLVNRSGIMVSPTVKYNFCESMGMLSSSGGVDPAHANFVQSWTLTGGSGSNDIDGMVCNFNCLYQPAAAVDGIGRNIPAAVDGLSRMQAGSSGTGGIGALNDFECGYNTCVSIATNHYFNNSGTSANTGSGFLEWLNVQGDLTSPVNRPNTHDNYGYFPTPPSLGFTNFPFYPTGGGNVVNDGTWANNINMFNNTAYTTTP